jgi:hypothetical protein
VYRRTLALCLALLPFLSRNAAAQETPEPGSELTVYLATMGPGDAVWEKFGHNAIWIRDANTRTTIAYNYGIFDFQQESFIPRLLKGDMLYSMGVSDGEQELANYAYADRSVWLQRLNLSSAQKHDLREFLEWNWLPENRSYRYDYFRDNCSTRVRDALDRVLGGALRQSLAGTPTGSTFRSHSLRLTADEPATFTGLLLGLGIPTDREIDAWEESFIPMELMRHLRSLQVRSPSGSLVPLVAEEVTAYESTRSDPRATTPRHLHWFLIAGLLLAAKFIVLARFAAHSAISRTGLSVAIFFWSLLTGFFGLILAMLWLFTSHTAAYPNMNLLQTSPLGLLLAVAAPLALRRRTGHSSRWRGLALWTSIVVSALSLAGLVLHMFMGARQHSAAIIALALPVHLATVLCLYRVLGPRLSATGDMAAPKPHPAAP